MDIFEKIGDTLVQVGKDVSQKATDLSGIAKLKLDIRTKENFIKDQYLALGKACYQEHREKLEDEEVRFAQIDEALDAIRKMELAILELKKARKCPQCGNEATDTAEYCSFCGAKLAVVVEGSPFEEQQDGMAEEDEKFQD